MPRILGLALALSVAQLCHSFIPAGRLGVSLQAPRRVSGRPATLVMAESIEVFMPALSSTMTEGKIVDWTVKVGDKVKAGQTVMVVESDKGKLRGRRHAVWVMNTSTGSAKTDIP